ncbi:uncharacterized protein [Dermacentor andersoni]|uniref:uncharacterized protein n=1 Tax=Dermacentor andersoni TaxID=34620 RepID=UPI003B3B29D2
MYLRRLTRLDLLVCDDLGVEADEQMKKPAIIKAIKDSGNDDESIKIAWDVIQEAREHERRERKRERQELKIKCERQKREREQKYEKEKAALEKQIQYFQQLKEQRQRLSENSVDSREQKNEELSSGFLPKANEKSSACESGCTFIDERKGLAGNDALVATEAVKSQSESDEVLCQQRTVETARPAANKLAQLPRVCVASHGIEVVSEVQGTVDPTDTSTRVESDLSAEVKCQLDDAVVGSLQDCELRSSREDNCIVQGSVQLSASLGSQERDDIVKDHSDCAGNRPIRADEMCTGQHEAREGDMKKSSRKNRSRKKRRKDRIAVTNVAPPKTTRDPKGQGARKIKVRSSLTMLAHQTRSGHRSKRDQEACSARTRKKGTGQLCSLSVRRSFRSSACSTKKRKVARRDQVVGSRDAVNRVRVESGAPRRKLAGDCNVLEELIVSQPVCCSSVARVAFEPRPPRVRLKCRSPS